MHHLALCMYIDSTIVWQKGTGRKRGVAIHMQSAVIAVGSICLNFQRLYLYLFLHLKEEGEIPAEQLFFYGNLLPEAR